MIGPLYNEKDFTYLLSEFGHIDASFNLVSLSIGHMMTLTLAKSNFSFFKSKKTHSWNIAMIDYHDRGLCMLLIQRRILASAKTKQVRLLLTPNSLSKSQSANPPEYKHAKQSKRACATLKAHVHSPPQASNTPQSPQRSPGTPGQSPPASAARYPAYQYTSPPSCHLACLAYTQPRQV